MGSTRQRKDEHHAADPAGIGVHLHYAFGPGEQRGADLASPLFDLLSSVRDGGSIRHAARALGCSYRFLWGALKKWESALNEPLIVWSRGQRARLTPFAERLLWAERRARTRMQPHIEALRADLARVLVDARDEHHQVLTVAVSHGLALPLLQQLADTQAALHLDIRFQGSIDSLRALNEGQCLVAGFPVPALQGGMPMLVKALKPLLTPGLHMMIGCLRRRQGLMLRREHASLVRSFGDLAHAPLRFVNRQVGSATRLLVDHLMHEAGADPRQLPDDLDLTEETHVAAAACIASGLADVGVGIEAAAHEFGLHFVPLVDEDYYLVCLQPNQGDPAVQRLCSVLAGPEWRDLLASLPGYAPMAAPGVVLELTAALPWWPTERAKTKRTAVPSSLVRPP
jgi:putative molybdopterin biosynthesis protein